MSRLKTGITIVFISFLLLLAIELSLRLFWPQATVISFVGPSLHIPLPDTEIGSLPRPHAKAIQTGSEHSPVEYVLNADGLRDSSPHRGDRTPGTIRVLLLGDSFTFGAGTQYENIWPVVLEQELTKRGCNVKFVKAGMLGGDTRTEYLFLQHIYPKFPSDIIVVVFLPNDLFTNVPSRKGASTEYVQTQAQSVGWFRKSEDLHSIILLERCLLSFDRLYTWLYLISPRSAYYTTPPSDTFREKIAHTEQIFSDFASYCQNNHSELIVVSIPQLFQVIWAVNGYSGPVDVDQIDRSLTKFMETLGGTWITTLPFLADLQKHGIETYYRFDGHLNKSGNVQLGIFLADKLQSRLSSRTAKTVGAGQVR